MQEDVGRDIVLYSAFTQEAQICVLTGTYVCYRLNDEADRFDMIAVTRWITVYVTTYVGMSSIAPADDGECEAFGCTVTDGGHAGNAGGHAPSSADGRACHASQTR